MDTKFYILFVWGMVEPDLMGPYHSSEERMEAARKLFAVEGNDEHLYFKLNMTDNLPDIYSYTEDELCL